MRIYRLVLAAGLWLGASSALAQQSASTIEVEQKEIGQLKVQSQKSDSSLGIISQLTRSSDRSIECNGLCYFQNGTQAAAWKCGPGKTCHLFCTVSPPVGACD